MCEEWSCSKCTFQNKWGDDVCSVCETEKTSLLDGLLGSSQGNNDETRTQRRSTGEASGKQRINVIDLALDDDKINFINLRVLTDTNATPVELMVDASLPLDIITARCLEACDCWNVCTAAIDMMSGTDADAWTRVSRTEELSASTSPRTVKIIVQKYHVFDNVHVDSIGQRIPTSHALTEYTEHTRKALEGIFPDYRRIRGDGNCFFRAVVFRLIETLSENLEEAAAAAQANDASGGEDKVNAASSALKEFCDLLTAAPALSRSELIEIQDLFAGLRAHAMLPATEKHDEKCGFHFSSQMRSSIPLDRLLTKASRHVIGNFLLTTAEAEARAHEAVFPSSTELTEVLPRTASTAPVISVADVVTANFDGQSVEAFVQGVVLADTRDAEDVIVALAGRAFKANVCIWQPEAGLGSGLKCLSGDVSVSHVNGDVHLLLFSGHYNLLYTTSAPEVKLNPPTSADSSLSAPSTVSAQIPHPTPRTSTSSSTRSVGEKRPRNDLNHDVKNEIAQGALFAPALYKDKTSQYQERQLQVNANWPRHSSGAVNVQKRKGPLAALDGLIPSYDEQDTED